MAAVKFEVTRPIPAGSRVLYAHLGGQPALSAYAGYPGLGAPERELSH